MGLFHLNSFLSFVAGITCFKSITKPKKKKKAIEQKRDINLSAKAREVSTKKRLMNCSGTYHWTINSAFLRYSGSDDSE